MVIERGDTLTYLLHLKKLQSSLMCFPKTKSRIIPFQGDGDSAPDTPPNEESTSNIDVDVVKKASMTHPSVDITMGGTGVPLEAMIS